MGIGSYKEAERYRMRTNKNLTRTFYLDTRRTLDEEPFAWEQVQNVPETDYQTEVDPGMVIPPQDVLPKNPIPNMPSAPGIPDPQFRQLELAEGGRVGFKFGGNVDKLKKLEQIILESNKDLYNALSKEEAAKRAGYTSAANLSGRKEMTRIFNNLIPVENKISNHFNDILKNIDNIPYQDIVDAGGFNKYLAKPFGTDAIKNSRKVSNVYNRPEFKDLRDIVKTISNPQVIETYGNKDMFIGNVIDNLDTKKGSQRLKGGNLTDDIIVIAERSKTAGNKNIQFLNKPGSVDASDIVFKWNGKLYGKNIDEYKGKKVNNLTTDLYKLPEFNEYLKAREKLNNLRDKEVIHPVTKEPITIDNLLKETYAKGFENNSFYKTSSLDLDHLNLKDKPFSDLRPLPKHINQTAGLIGKTHSIIEDKNKALNAIGYNIPENALEDSVLKFSDRVLNKGIPISKTYDVGLRSITGGSKEYLSPESEITTSGLKEGKPTTEDLFKGETQVRTSSGLRAVSEKEPRIPKEFSEQKIQDIEKILNPEEKRAINLLNRINFGADPNLVKELYGKEISLVKNLINKVPAPVRAVGKIFGLTDVVLETILAAPDVLQGDIEAAKRGSIFGLFGYGKELDEELLEQAKNKESVQRAIQNLKLTPELRNLMEEKKGIEQSLFKGNLDTEQASILSQNLNTIDSRIKEINDYLNKNEYLEEDETNFLNTALNLAKSKAKKAEEMFGPQFKQAQGPTLEQTLFKKILDEGDYSEFIPEESKQKIAGTYIPIEIPEIQSPDDSMREGFKKGGMSKRGFLKLLGGTVATGAVAPDLIKAIKGGKKATQAGRVASKIKFEPAEGMYSWFPDLVEKIKTKGKPFEEKEIIMEASYKHEAKGYGGLPKGVETVTRHVDGDTEFLLREYPDGRIAVDIHSPRNQEGSSTPVTLYYRPTMEQKYYSGTKVEPAEFKVLEKEPRYFANGPDDVDIEMSETRKIPGKNTIYGDVEAAERFATGKIENRKIIPVKQARREQMEDAPTDFIEETSPYGPDTF
jgi:hypothetical protein